MTTLSKSEDFKAYLVKHHQVMAYSDVRVYEKNGVVELEIQMSMNSAYAMMLYQALLWPEHFDMRLRPFAIDHAAFLWNSLPCNLLPDLTPLEV